MHFLHQAATASVLVTLTLIMQSAGLGLLIHWARSQLRREIGKLGPFHCAGLLVRCMSVMILFHLLQILLWAGLYRWICFPTWETSFYFSAASYSTVGYGDLLLPQAWRTLGPIESVAGVLMCGLSASFLFAVVTRLVEQVVHDDVESDARAQRESYAR
jgi:hypothetical protein